MSESGRIPEYMVRWRGDFISNLHWSEKGDNLNGDRIREEGCGNYMSI